MDAGIRVCLDCDYKIYGLDNWHKLDENGYFIGCEGYRHPMRLVQDIEIDEVMQIASEITRQFKELGEKNPQSLIANEDYCDAFESVSELFSMVSARLLYNVYKDDKDATITDHMSMMLRQATEKAEEAIDGLSAFGITR